MERLSRRPGIKRDGKDETRVLPLGVQARAGLPKGRDQIWPGA